MKTKKSIWSIALGLIVILALVLSFGLSSQRATVKAEEPVDHITFNVTVDGDNEKTIESNHSNLLEVRYTVTENTGVDAMQLRLDFSSAFTLERIEALKSTSLGEPTITNGTKVNEPINGENYVAYENITLEENNNYIGANIVYEHVNNTYLATGDALIIAYYRLNNNPTEEVYPFGFWRANNEDGFSTAWKNVANAEQSGTHTPVRINYTDAVVYIMGDYEFTLTGGQKVYDGVPAANSAITVSDNNNENGPDLTYVWFEGISSNSDTYRKLDSNPVNAGQYFVVLEYEATNRYRAYKGYTQTAEPGVYTLDSTEGHVATYIITQRSITITATAQSAIYTGEEPTVNQSAYTVVDNEDVKLENIASLVSGVNISKVEGVNAGNYTLTPSLVNTNYSITFVNGTFTITQRHITITATNQNATYTGSEPTVQKLYTVADAEETPLANISSLVSAENVSITKAPGVNVGNYDLTPALNDTNFIVNAVKGTFTIESVGEDVEYIKSFFSGLTENYDATTHNLLKVETNKPEWIAYVASNNNQKNAGEYQMSITVTVSEQDAKNHIDATLVGDQEYVFTKQGAINKAALTITADAEVQYSDAAPVISVDNGTNGWVASENYETYNTSAEALKAYVGSNYASTMTAGTEYTLSWNEGAKAAIEAILTNYDVTLEVENVEVAKKVLNAADYAFAGYTGTYDAANHTLAVTGNLDLVNVTISSQATVKNYADSGNYTATIALKDANNYTFENGTHTGWTVDGNSASKQATVSITKVELEIGVEYEKTTATFSISGFVGGETAEVLTDLVYKADGAVSANISGNVYTISEYVANAIAISATSSNSNYTIAPETLRNIRKVEYVCDHDLGTNMPANELLFNGFKAVQPEAVSLTHYTFEGYKVANNKDAEDFDYNQNIEENKTIYVVFVENEKYSLTLYYMVEGDAEHLTQVGEVLEFYSDDAIRYGHELPSMTAKDWFKVQEWYTDEALTTKYVEGTLSANTTLYANYKFNIGLGDVNANGYVDAHDITLYRQWIVGGYGEIEVEAGAEWALVNSDAYLANKASEAPKAYFVKRVADSNALTAESTVLGDEHFDIRDVSTIRMGLVGGYGFAIVEGKTVDGEALLVTRTVTIENMSDLLAVARSGKAVQLAGDITEENFVGAIVNCGNDVVIDLNGHTITVKSLSISLAENNTGKIEIKNGRINVADGNGVHLSAPAGSIVLDNVTLYDRDGIFELQAADHSLHFNNEVKFLKDEQGVKVPAAVKVENGTHVVVEEAAVVTVEKLVVTESFVPVQEASDAKITINVESVVPQEIIVDGYVEIEAGAEEYVKPTYLEVATNAEFIAAANQTDIKVIKLTEDLVDLGTVTFVGNVTIEGNGHIISGNSALRLNKLGAKVSNVKFQNIHNSTSQLTPVYGTNLEGKLEIENCEFNTVDWDAIQITPVAGAEVVIKNNIFKHSGENAVNTRRYVHIQSATNVDFAATVENNKFYNVEILSDTAIEVYYPTNESKVVILNNYVDAPVGVCILKNSGANAWYLANSFVEEDLETPVVMKAAIVETYNVYFFRTLQEAVDFAGQNQTTITLIDDASGDGVIVPENSNITFDFAGHTYTVNGKLVGSKGTETNGFQLLKNSNVTFKNGTLKTVNAKMLIQNYANTTLDNFTVSGEGATQLQYVTSNNFGSLTVKDGSKILAYNNQVAFDLWYGMSAVYDDGVTVTLKAGSEVVGKVEYGAATRTLNNNMPIKAQLIVEDGAVWGKEITLSSDVYVDHQIVIDKDVTLELNGKTVKYVGDETLASGLFGVKRGATLTINDTKGTGKIDASSNKIYAAVAITLKGEAATGEKAKVVVNGGTLEGYYYAIVGNGSRHNTEVVVNNGTLYGLNGTAIYNPQDGLVTINNGHIKGLDTAIEIRAGQLVINDGVFEALSQVYSVTANGSGTTVVGAIIAISQHTTLKNITVTINGGTFTNGICAFAIVDTTDTSNNNLINVIINGGTFNNDQVINNLAELKAFRDAVNAGNNFAGKTVTLNADITLDGAWTPISNYSRKDSDNQSKWFAGTFDGNGHTISGLTNANLVAGNITEKEEYTYGLFGSVNNAVIKNLTLTNVSISASNGDSLGALVGYYANGTQKAEANISNITISGSVYGSDNVGGVVGRANGTYFKALNVIVSGTVTADYKASGLVGTGNANEMVFENCTNNAAVSSTTVRADNAGYNAVAGISITWKDACQKVVMTGCANNGTISTVNANAIAGALAVDYSPKTQLNANGTWTYANGHWTQA